MDTAEIRAAVIDIMNRERITLASKFVPLSRSRNAGKWQSLNWRVTLHKAMRPVLETDYSAGSAHCPSSKQKDSKLRKEMIAFECEQGKAARSTGFGVIAIGGAIEPDTVDVVNALVRDADVIDYGGFEGWASEFGYDTDSREAESIYRECLENALKLRAGIGDSVLAELREALQDY